MILSDKPTAAVALNELSAAKNDILKRFKSLERAEGENYKEELKKASYLGCLDYLFVVAFQAHFNIPRPAFISCCSAGHEGLAALRGKRGLWKPVDASDF